MDLAVSVVLLSDRCSEQKEDVYKRQILEFIKNNAKIKRNITISWFGGEPLLKFADIKRMLHKACQYGDEYGCKITSDITTNGYLLNEQNIREMKQLNVKSIQITIDGDRESHNKRRYLAGADVYKRQVYYTTGCRAVSGVRI